MLRLMRFSRVAPLLLLMLAAPALAQTPTTTREAEKHLDNLERELRDNKSRMADLEREAAKLAEEDFSLRRQLIRASEAVREREADLSALETRLGDLDAQEARLRNGLAARADSRGRLVSGLVRLSRRPALSWLDPRVDAGDAVRGAVLLRATLPIIEKRAAEIRDELNDLRALRAEIEDQRRIARDAASSLDSEREKVTALLEERKSRSIAAQSEKADTARRLATIAAEAKSIRELQAKLERQRVENERRLREERLALGVEAPEAPARRLNPGQLRGFPKKASGALTSPVIGRLARVFGMRDSVGEKTEGVDIQTRADAQVVAPYDGEIVFAGPFVGYGRMLMIKHKGDYFSMLAGLGRLDVAVGDVVLEGEPIGVMSGKGASATLYYELRRRDRPVDPQPWLDRRTGKGIG